MPGFHNIDDSDSCLVCRAPGIEMFPVGSPKSELVPLCIFCKKNVIYYGWGIMCRDFSGLEKRLKEYGWSWVEGQLVHESRRR